MTNKVKGTIGEMLAREFLECHGYAFVDANYHRRVGEIDLIMRDCSTHDGVSTIVFTEVRYRSTSDYGGALESIDWKKQRKMLRAAQAWLQRHANHNEHARIDVIALQPSHCALSSEQHLWKNHSLHWIQNAVEC